MPIPVPSAAPGACTSPHTWPRGGVVRGFRLCRHPVSHQRSPAVRDRPPAACARARPTAGKGATLPPQHAPEPPGSAPRRPAWCRSGRCAGADTRHDTDRRPGLRDTIPSLKEDRGRGRRRARSGLVQQTFIRRARAALRSDAGSVRRARRINAYSLGSQRSKESALIRHWVAPSWQFSSGGQVTRRSAGSVS